MEVGAEGRPVEVLAEGLLELGVEPGALGGEHEDVVHVHEEVDLLAVPPR